MEGTSGVRRVMTDSFAFWEDLVSLDSGISTGTITRFAGVALHRQRASYSSCSILGKRRLSTTTSLHYSQGYLAKSAVKMGDSEAVPTATATASKPIRYVDVGRHSLPRESLAVRCHSS